MSDKPVLRDVSGKDVYRKRSNNGKQNYDL